MMALWDRGEFVAEREDSCRGAGDGRRRAVAGDGRRIAEGRKGGGEMEPCTASRWRHRTPRTASSRALPVRLACWRRTSSTRSTLSSSPRAGSCSTGRHMS
jgi:hypothetical protein